MALADDHISDEEKKFIDRPAIYLEINPDMVKKVMESLELYKADPPADKNSRLERLYDLSKMIFANNIADENEKNLLEKMLIGLSFETNQTNQVV